MGIGRNAELRLGSKTNPDEGFRGRGAITLWELFELDLNQEEINIKVYLFNEHIIINNLIFYYLIRYFAYRSSSLTILTFSQPSGGSRVKNLFILGLELKSTWFESLIGTVSVAFKAINKNNTR